LPDFSPIEETFSKIKSYLRRVGARTREALEEAIAQALETVTSQDAHSWFTHCGYLPSSERNALLIGSIFVNTAIAVLCGHRKYCTLARFQMADDI
jgi:hypothetical protein